MMPLDRAISQAAGIVAALAPHCRRVMAVGSIRRGRPQVRDIDILAWPGASAGGQFLAALWGLGPVKSAGPKIITLIQGPGSRVQGPGGLDPRPSTLDATQVDIYLASAETWATLQLIRTGSAEHNVHLAGLAKRRGWRLEASGRGLVDGAGELRAWEREEDFFAALGVPYGEPWRREMPRFLAGDNRPLTEAEKAGLEGDDHD